VHDTIRLGRIAGIRVGLNWSWVVVLALLVWTLASAVFPATDPGLSNGTYIGMGAVAALLFFVSLLLHELGHALEARREGMEIEGITLWLFGGVARFKGAFPSAGAEFRIAVAGPLVTAVLGGGFVGLAMLTHFSSAIDGVVAWLGYINLVLLAFNLVPALPLDGGRIFRALLWRAKGDYAWATRVAVDVSRAFGYLMIGAGVVLFAVQGTFTGVWFAFLGWFLLTAAGGEARYAAARRALDGLTVGDLMVRAPVTAEPGQTLGEFIDEASWEGRHTVYPVVDDGRFVGLLASSAVVAVPRDEWDVRRVGDSLLPRGETPILAESEDAFEALTALTESPLRRGPVLDGERLVGFLSLSDIERALGSDGRGPSFLPRPVRRPLGPRGREAA
jgi:Zn-dependent protease